MFLFNKRHRIFIYIDKKKKDNSFFRGIIKIVQRFRLLICCWLHSKWFVMFVFVVIDHQAD